MADSGCSLLPRMKSIFTRLKAKQTSMSDPSFSLVSVKPGKDAGMEKSWSPPCRHKEGN